MLITGTPVWADAPAQDPTQWEAAMSAFAAEDNASSPPPNSIVFTGSSSIVQWKTLMRDMAPLTVINRGFGGSTMKDAIYWVEKLVIQYKPRAIVLYTGDNDLGFYGVTPEELNDEFGTFVSRVRGELPNARIYLLSIKPSVLRMSMWPEMRRANGLLREFCETHPGIYFIDVASPMLDGRDNPRPEIFEPDGLHMTSKGYEIWSGVAKPVLMEHEDAQ